jgi:hypothetical protein
MGMDLLVEPVVREVGREEAAEATLCLDRVLVEVVVKVMQEVLLTVVKD